MKLFFSLSALFISIILMVNYTNSSTTAAVKNETTLSVTLEESALIAINYTDDKNVQLINNTDKSIVIKSIKLVSDQKHKVINTHFPFSLPPGHSQEFTIANNKDLSGKVLTVSVQWNGGTANIKSTIPKLDIEEISPESIEELIEPEVDNEKTSSDSIDEQIEPAVDSELEEDDDN